MTAAVSYQCCSDVLLHYNEQFGGTCIVHRTPCWLLGRKGGEAAGQRNSVHDIVEARCCVIRERKSLLSNSRNIDVK